MLSDHSICPYCSRNFLSCVLLSCSERKEDVGEMQGTNLPWNSIVVWDGKKVMNPLCTKLLQYLKLQVFFCGIELFGKAVEVLIIPLHVSS